ncbi:NAD(P)/FAD-dependent oxidoreductase [Bordetella petrii]|uniref:NAD(P)/FAD-dependent oxidoreductase n=1 Tax=Bordetella petrii TaxID=94624 RepID=UPI003733D669
MTSVAVVGAGIIGLSTAANLQRMGLATTVFDALPPGNCTSYGNAGMVSVAAAMPMAMPGMLRNVPRWLRDPEGPLFINPRYLPAALPWLLRWVRAGAAGQVKRSSQGLWQLHRHALDEYRRLLGAAHFSSLIQTIGQIHVWDSPTPSASERIGAAIREELGIPAETLSQARLREMVPELTPDISRALYLPQNGNTINPLRLAETVAGIFAEAGGRIVHEKAARIVPEGSRYRLLTNRGDHCFDKLVVAAGAWSLELLGPLGLGFPLETERGYHVQIASANIQVPYPVLHKGRGFGACAMETGLRIAGTVEIAGLHNPPEPRRAEALIKNARRLLPRLEVGEYKMWMGYRPSTPDTLPVLGASARHPGVYIACGHGHTGVTAGAVSGRLVAELVAGVQPFIDPAPYRLERFS